MPLPEITHLQFAVLCELMSGQQAGQAIRASLVKQKVRTSLAAFYQLMARLEDAKFVEGWYEQKTVKGYAVKERQYKLTGAGARTVERTHDFYVRLVASARSGGLAHAS